MESINSFVALTQWLMETTGLNGLSTLLIVDPVGSVAWVLSTTALVHVVDGISYNIQRFPYFVFLDIFVNLQASV